MAQRVGHVIGLAGVWRRVRERGNGWRCSGYRCCRGCCCSRGGGSGCCGRRHGRLVPVVLAQVLADLRVAVLVVGNDDLAGLGGGDARLAVELARQIALPVLFVLADVLDAERVAIVHQQRLAALAEHELQLALRPLLTRSD